ncbi:hypothetical protein M758_6G106900 [Ceratodon purpureus]|nr:hypothetical protein M758_6G106900 [Ceratodon purpureus]
MVLLRLRGLVGVVGSWLKWSSLWCSGPESGANLLECGCLEVAW